MARYQIVNHAINEKYFYIRLFNIMEHLIPNGKEERKNSRARYAVFGVSLVNACVLEEILRA